MKENDAFPSESFDTGSVLTDTRLFFRFFLDCFKVVLIALAFEVK